VACDLDPTLVLLLVVLVLVHLLFLVVVVVVVISSAAPLREKHAWGFESARRVLIIDDVFIIIKRDVL
jgi:hypothetical protein